MQGNPRSHGLWERTAPPAPSTSTLAGEATGDAVVIGAGFTGLSAALHLGRRGRRAVVLDAAEIGFGASGRNSGLVNAGMWVMPDALVATLGPVYGQRLIGVLSQAPSVVFGLASEYAMACEADHRGTYHLGAGARGRAQLQLRAEQWRRLGVKLDLLDAAETTRRTGAICYSSSLYDPRAGTIQPLAYARGLARAALGAGASIYTQSRVISFAHDGDVWRVSTDGGTVRAKWLVVATDAYSGGPTAAVRGEQVHLPYFHVSTPPLGDNVRRTILPDGGGTWDTKTVLSGFRMDRDGRLVIGSVGALRGLGSAVHRAWARRYIRKILPQVGDVDFETEWYGKIGMTGDHLPRLHTFGPNSIGISAYNGRGIAPGTVMGREIAELVLGAHSLEEMPLPVSRVEAAALRPLREAYYEVGAQIAHSPLSPA